MDPFLPSRFFDLRKFEHASLFDHNEPVWLTIKRLEKYLKLVSLGKIEAEVQTGAILIHPELISIGKGSVIEAGAYVVGPCLLGDNTQIRHGAYLRGNILAGNNCVFGHATEVKNSVLLNDVKAGHFAYIGDSILGNRVNLGAGTKCANLRFDKKNIHILWEQKRIDTGLNKFGAILADDSQTGCNSVTNPGTFLFKSCLLPPCSVAKGFIKETQAIAGVL